MSRNITQNEINENFESYWKPLIETNGEIDIEKVKKELFDYYTAIEEVSAVYDEITNGRFSKPNTARQYIIQAVRDIQEQECEVAINESN